MRISEDIQRRRLELFDELARLAARQEIAEMLAEIVNDLNLSGLEADSRLADTFERALVRLTARTADEETESAGKARTCPVAPDVCGDITGWEAFLTHIYVTHTHTSQSEAQRRDTVQRILERGGARA